MSNRWFQPCRVHGVGKCLHSGFLDRTNLIGYDHAIDRRHSTAINQKTETSFRRVCRGRPQQCYLVKLYDWIDTTRARPGFCRCLSRCCRHLPAIQNTQNNTAGTSKRSTIVIHLVARVSSDSVCWVCLFLHDDDAVLTVLLSIADSCRVPCSNHPLLVRFPGWSFLS